MNGSSAQNMILASMFIVLAAVKIKDRCQYCFIGLLVIGFLFLIFGIVKFIKQRHG